MSALRICEKLRDRTRDFGRLPDETPALTNPDGPKAAAIIERLYDACELALAMLPSRGGLNSPTGRLRSKLRAALEEARGESA